MSSRGFFLLWLKIYVELILLSLLFFIFETLLWWAIMDISKVFFSCRLTETALFRPPGIICPDNLSAQAFFQIWANISAFFGLAFLASFIYPVIPILMIFISLLLSIWIARSLQIEEVQTLRKPLVIFGLYKVVKNIFSKK